MSIVIVLTLALHWARAAQGCQLCHQSCSALDSKGKAEEWSTKDNLAKASGSGNEDHEPHLGYHPDAGLDRQGWRSFVAALDASWRDGQQVSRLMVTNAISDLSALRRVFCYDTLRPTRMSCL